MDRLGGYPCRFSETTGFAIRWYACNLFLFKLRAVRQSEDKLIKAKREASNRQESSAEEGWKRINQVPLSKGQSEISINANYS